MYVLRKWRCHEYQDKASVFTSRLNSFEIFKRQTGKGETDEVSGEDQDENVSLCQKTRRDKHNI